MFETIANLITIAFWLAAITLFGFGLFGCGSKLFQGDGMDKFLAILGMFLGALAFYWVYTWLESILWCMIISGVILDGFAFGNTDTGERRNPNPGPIEVLTDELVQYQRDKEVVKNALREWEQER